MQTQYHSSGSLANVPSDSRVCYLADTRFLSSFSPLSAIKWLFTDLSIDGFKSFASFVNEKPWNKGIANINIPLLRALGMNKSRCDALESGFDLGFQSPPPVQDTIPKNYSSIDNYGELIQKKLLGDIDVGTLEVFDVSKAKQEGHACIFHPLGAVPKGVDDCRIIVDTSITGLNDSLMSPPLAFPSIRTILNGTRPGGYGCSFDLSSYFHQLKVRPDQVNFLCITLPDGTTARYRSICFGLRPAPFLAQGTTMDIRDLAIRVNILDCASMVFVDDFSSTHDSGDYLAMIRIAFIAFMGMLGFVLHPAKQPLPSQIFNALGYTADTVNLKLSISGDKQTKRLILVESTLKKLLEDGYITLNQAQSLVGKLTHSAVVVLTGRFHISPWWSAIARAEKDYRLKHQLDETVIVPKQTRVLRSQPLIDSLRWWQGALQDKDKLSRNLYVRHDGFLDIFDEEAVQDSTLLELHSLFDPSFIKSQKGVIIDMVLDASPIAFGCIYSTTEKKNISIYNTFLPEFWLTDQIQLELLAVRESLSKILRSTPNGLDPSIPKFVSLKTDCQNIVSLINDWSFKSQIIGNSLKGVADLAFTHNCQIIATLVNRQSTLASHNLASTKNLSLCTKTFKCHSNFNIDLQKYHSHLIIHRDSLKHLKMNKRSMSKIKICFPSKISSMVHQELSSVTKDIRISNQEQVIFKFKNTFKKSCFTFATISF